MASVTAKKPSGPIDSILRDCAAALERVAAYRLPSAVDCRLLWLSENKERLSELERDELMALVEFAEERTAEKLQAKAALKRLADVLPDLLNAKRPLR